MPATPAWLAQIESVLNRNIDAQARTRMLMRRLEGKSLQLDVDGRLRVRALAARGRLALLAGDDSPADAVISGSGLALLGMMTGSAAPVARDSPVSVRGDAEVAEAYRELLSLARPDPEEEAARLIGDVPARRLGNLARRTFGWLERAQRSFGENLAEYLTEESRDLVNRTELDEFLRGVDDVRDWVDRLEARIRRLEQRASGGL
ncbi:MAG: SCP2 domain-containing protein [Steroidobacterales bacterium]